jgi:regulator of sigma E protease
METVLIKALQLIVAFVILVTVHEFGHYLFARIFGMRVDRFYLFFNPWFSILKYDPREGTLQLIGWTKGDKEHALKTFHVGKKHPRGENEKSSWRDTLYGLGWLPLGGYCSIAGMIDETTDKDKLSSTPEPWEFRAKKPFPRLMVMLAGVIFNFILAIIIYIGILFYWGEKTIDFDTVDQGMLYSQELLDAGFNNHDILLTINGEKADAADDNLFYNLSQDGTKVTVLRDHKDTVAITIPQGFLKSIANKPKEYQLMTYLAPARISKIVSGEGASHSDLAVGDQIVKIDNDTIPSFYEASHSILEKKDSDVEITYLRDGKTYTTTCHVNENGKIGIQFTDPAEIYPIRDIKYSFFKSIPAGIGKGVDRLVMYVSSLKLLFSKEGAESIGGFGAIADLYPDQWNWRRFWELTAFISVILAFMNILPIPALDGGHALFTVYEMVTRRKPSDKFLERAQIVGMSLLFLLLIYANANDIYRFFFK